MKTLHEDNSKVPNNDYDKKPISKATTKKRKRTYGGKKRKKVKSNDPGKKINKGDIGEQACV